jgi:hypothetical protein
LNAGSRIGCDHLTQGVTDHGDAILGKSSDTVHGCDIGLDATAQITRGVIYEQFKRVSD